VHPLVAAAWEALDTAGVRWALLRGERDLGDPHGDVDVLLDDRRAVRAVERALRPLGIVPLPEVGAGAHGHFVGYHRPTRRSVELDTEWELNYGPQHHFVLNWLAPSLRTGAAPAVLARRRPSPEVPGTWVLHPDDGFWALLLHLIIDKATVPEHHADRLVELSEHATASGPLARAVTAACPGGWDAERIIRRARAGDWPALVDLGRVLTRRATARRPVVHRVGALVRGLQRLGLTLGSVLRARRPPGAGPGRSRSWRRGRSDDGDDSRGE